MAVCASEDYDAMAKSALAGTLELEKLGKLSAALRLEPELALEIGLTPDRYPALVAGCPDLALVLLVSLSEGPHAAEYSC